MRIFGDAPLVEAASGSARDGPASASVAVTGAGASGTRGRGGGLVARLALALSKPLRTNDSIRLVSARLAKLQSDVQNDHYEMNRNILTLQELSGQSQRRLQELRGAMEE